MTLLPPPNGTSHVDDEVAPLHERQTLPPSPSDFPSPEVLNMADRHAQRLTAIEASMGRLADTMARIDSNITALMVAARARQQNAFTLKRDMDVLRARVMQFVDEEH